MKIKSSRLAVFGLTLLLIACGKQNSNDSETWIESKTPELKTEKVIKTEHSEAENPSYYMGNLLYYTRKENKKGECLDIQNILLDIDNEKEIYRYSIKNILPDCINVYNQMIYLKQNKYLIKLSDESVRIIDQNKNQILSLENNYYQEKNNKLNRESIHALEPIDLGDYILWNTIISSALYKKSDILNGEIKSIWRKTYDKYNFDYDRFSVAYGHAIDKENKIIYVASNGITKNFLTVQAYNYTGSILWSKDFPFNENSKYIETMPLYSIDGKLIYLDDRKNLYAFDGKTGEIVWTSPDIEKFSKDLGNSTNFFQSYKNNLYYYPDSGTHFLNFDLNTGRLKWKKDLKDYDGSLAYTITSKPIIRNGLIYVPNHRMYVFDADTGELNKWLAGVD